MRLLRIRPPSFEWVLLEKDEIVLSGAGDHYPEHDECELIVPAANVLLTRAELPKTNRLSDIAAFAAEESLISDPERNHVVPGPKLSDGKHALAVVDDEWMKSVLARLAKSAIAPDRALVESLMPAIPAHSWVLVMDDTCGFLKTGPFSAYPLDSNGAEPPVGLGLALQSESRPEAIVVHAKTSPELEKWQEKLSVRLTKDAAWDWKTCEPATRFNLLSGAYASKRKEIDWKPFRPALIFAVLMLVLQLFGIAYDWAHLAREKHAMLSEMEHIFRTSFPEARIVVDAPLQMQRKFEEMNRSTGDPGDFLPLLASVSPALSDLAPGILTGIDYSSDGLDLLFDFPGDAAFDDFKSRLDKSGIQTQTRKKDRHGERVEVLLHLGRGT